MVLIDGAEVRNMALMCLMEFVVGRGSIYGVWLYIYIIQNFFRVLIDV